MAGIIHTFIPCTDIAVVGAVRVLRATPRRYDQITLPLITKRLRTWLRSRYTVGVVKTIAFHIEQEALIVGTTRLLTSLYVDGAVENSFTATGRFSGEDTLAQHAGDDVARPLDRRLAICVSQTAPRSRLFHTLTGFTESNGTRFLISGTICILGTTIRNRLALARTVNANRLGARCSGIVTIIVVLTASRQ